MLEMVELVAELMLMVDPAPHQYLLPHLKMLYLLMELALVVFRGGIHMEVVVEVQKEQVELLLE